jgi:hypothetical protein
MNRPKTVAAVVILDNGVPDRMDMAGRDCAGV